ncbi:hypothetical protein, conserved [Plasmodium gonderi]|uniref:Uncharacterized protein n=1 Tax=Plasmodium gonderi TaxID=77519 RepID=A0A1Y1JCA2_PLAGO|nr:hypothetical protein, conserved [Plasmodium gonderi]GAW79298.1 hypothetical protein, conserved [Plasmodium gonderi]
MHSGDRIDNRHFDYVLPVHVDIDQINEVNKTCIYISGNTNPYVYCKNTSGKLTKILGGSYNYEVTGNDGTSDGDTNKENKIKRIIKSDEICGDKTLLGNGTNSVVATTLIGPILNNQMFSKGIESAQFNIRIKNIQGFRNNREKIFEEIITKNFEKIIDHGSYKYQQFHIRVQILHECSYILSSIINSIILNFIHNNISMNFIVNSINVGIVDKTKFGAYVAELSHRKNLAHNRTNDQIASNGPKNEIKNDHVFPNSELLTEKLFYCLHNKTYIPKIILDPLDEEVQLYCSSAFCFIIAPDFHKILSNIVIKNSIGISKEVFTLSKSYALQVSKLLHSSIRSSYISHLRQMETCLNTNYFS